MIKIRLSPKDVQQAHSWNNAILATGLADTPNYTGIRVLDRFFVGYLGEIAVGRWLTQEGVPHEHHVSVTGRRSDRPEFLVDRRHKLEVKTAGEPFHTRFMLPASQTDIHADCYAGARLLSVEPHCDVELWGWLHDCEVRTLQIGDFGRGPTRWCPLKEMNDLYELLWLWTRARVSA